MWWSPDVRLSDVRMVEERLNNPESSYVVNNPMELQSVSRRPSNDDTRVVSTCRDYLQSVADGFLALTTRAAQQETDFVRDCYLLRDLRRAAIAKTSYVSRLWNATALDELPPLLRWAPGQSKNTGGTWRSAAPGLRITKRSGQTLDAEDGTSTYELQIVGQADFSGDGVADLAVVGVVKAKDGTFVSSNYYILTRCTPTGVFRLLSSAEAPYQMTSRGCEF